MPPTTKQAKPKAEKNITTQAAMDKAVKEVCNILRRDKAKGARLYVPELTWMFFLCYFDILERKAEQESVVTMQPYSPVIPSPYRWRDWAAQATKPQPSEEKQGHEERLKEIVAQQAQGWKRVELWDLGGKSILKWVNEELFPFLISLKTKGENHRQRVIGEIFATKERTVLTSDTNLLDAIDKVNEIASAQISDQHMFPISQAFEGLLPMLGDKQNDGGQFFTPREVIRLIVEVANPQLGKTVYDPCCGTGGFLIEAYHHIVGQRPSGLQLEQLKSDTFYGREDAPEAIPILLANLVLHNIESPKVWHGNTLTGAVSYDGLFVGAPKQYDYILTNPPFGSKESSVAQANFAYKTGKAQILFLQHIITSLKEGGTCGMVIDEGVLFHTKTEAYRQTKRKLMNECDLFCIISLPGGVFVNAGAGVKTDLLFFTKGKRTERIWFYDMTLTDDFKPRKVNKGNPLLLSHFSDFLHRLRLPTDDPARISERSWYLTRAEAEAKDYDLKAVNNNAPDFTDKRTPAELYKIIEEAQGEIERGLMALRGM